MTVRMMQPGALGADHLGVTPAIERWYDVHDIAFSIRYCEPVRAAKWGEDLDAEQIEWHANTGRGLLLNWERSTHELLGGAAVGRRVGMFMRTMALDLRYPVECPLFISADMNVTDVSVGLVSEAIEAFAAAIAPWPLGIYGNSTILAAMSDLDPYGWRAAADAWGPVFDGMPYHVQQHVPELVGAVDRNTVIAPIPVWFPDEPIWPMLFPWQYGDDLVTMAELGWLERSDFAEPTWWERLESYLRSQTGSIGVGQGFRAQQPTQIGFAPPGKSFHEVQEYADGSRWWTAADLVRRNPDGGNHLGVRPDDNPHQGSPWAAETGVHINVGVPTQSYPRYEAWHLQPIEIDGHDTWDAAGRPRPDPTYPYRSYTPAPPAPELTDPLPIPEVLMSDLALVRIPGTGVFGWPSMTPASQALLPVLTASVEDGGAGLTMVTESDPDDIWAAVGAALGKMHPGAARLMLDRYNATTDRVDIPEVTVPIPESPDVTVDVVMPDRVAVTVENWPPPSTDPFEVAIVG